MLLKCEIVVANRLSPGQGDRRCHGTLVFGKKKCGTKPDDEVFFTLHTMRNKSGMKYKIIKNIGKVHTGFVHEGKCTISMLEPPHDLIISKTEESELKKFLHILRLILKGERSDSIDELKTGLHVKKKDLEKPKTNVNICSRQNYPLKEGFPKSLESLTITNCFLKKFDSRILRLKNLKTLDLTKNSLCELCESLDQLECLRWLNLSNNNFQYLPSCLLKGNTSARLIRLDLSSNKLTSIPRNISVLKNIIYLNFNDNLLQTLPSSIGYMRQLKHLEIAKNGIKCLPWSFSQLSLDHIDLSGNSFSVMDPQVLILSQNLNKIQSLFELAARYVVKKKIWKMSTVVLPRSVALTLENATYCPCGEACVTGGIPFVKEFDVSSISSSVGSNSHDHIVKIMSCLCSRKCTDQYLTGKLRYKHVSLIR